MNTSTTPTFAPRHDGLAELELEPPWASCRTTVRHLSPGRLDQQAILSVRACVREEEAEAFIANTLHDVRAYMQEHHVQPAGPPFSISRPRDGAIDIEAGWPIAKAVPGTGRIHGGALPRSFLEPEIGRRLP
jgi:hypothetical protein